MPERLLRYVTLRYVTLRYVTLRSPSAKVTSVRYAPLAMPYTHGAPRRVLGGAASRGGGSRAPARSCSSREHRVTPFFAFGGSTTRPLQPCGAPRAVLASSTWITLRYVITRDYVTLRYVTVPGARLRVTQQPWCMLSAPPKPKPPQSWQEGGGGGGAAAVLDTGSTSDCRRRPRLSPPADRRIRQRWRAASSC